MKKEKNCETDPVLENMIDKKIIKLSPERIECHSKGDFDNCFKTLVLYSNSRAQSSLLRNKDTS